MRLRSNASGKNPGAFRLWGGLAVLATLCLTGCGRVPPADLNIHNGPEIETLDPHILTGQPDGRVAAALFEGLTRFNPTNALPIPGLAHRWDISPDGRTYTFHLRTNAAWSTGEPITAADFVWSWRRAVAPETAADYSGFFYYVKGGRGLVDGASTNLNDLAINAPGPHTFVVELENPTPFFPDLCAMRIMAVIPRWMVERHGDQWVRAEPLPCSGPYEMVSWRPNDRIRIRRNPRYWDRENVLTDRVDFVAGDSAPAALNLFLTGAVDVILDKNMIPSELNDVLRERPDFHTFDYLGTYFMRFNVTRKPFDDVRVRQAVSLVIDKRRIIERITRLGERPASAFTPPMAGYEPPPGLTHNVTSATSEAAYAEEMSRNITQAKRLLTEAGYPEGRGFPPFSYMFNAGGGGGARMHEQVGIELQAMVREHLGLQMEMRPVEWKTYLTDMSALNFDTVRGAWIGDYQDPTTFLDCFLANSGNNRTGWRSAGFDRLLAEAAAQSDPRQREETLRRAETLLVRDEVPICPLYYYTGFYAFDPAKIGGIHPNLTDEHPVWAMFRR